MILFVKIVAGAAVTCLVFAGWQWYVRSNCESNASKKELAYATERAAALDATATAEREAREREQTLQSRVNELEAKDANSAVELAKRDARIRAHAATTSVLNARLTAFTAPREPSGDPQAAAVDLQNRIATLGTLLRERDEMAAESERYADDIGDELRTCRAYAVAVSTKP